MIGNYYKLKRECNINNSLLFLVPQISSIIKPGSRSIVTHLYNYGLINTYTEDRINDPLSIFKNHLFLLFDKSQVSCVDEKAKTPLDVGGKIKSYLEFFQGNDCCVDTYDILDSYIMVVLDLHKLKMSKEDLEFYNSSRFSALSNEFSKGFLQPPASRKYLLDYSGVIMYNVIKKTETLVRFLSIELNVYEDVLLELYEKVQPDIFDGQIKTINLNRFQEGLEEIFNELKKVDKEIEESKK